MQFDFCERANFCLFFMENFQICLFEKCLNTVVRLTVLLLKQRNFSKRRDFSWTGFFRLLKKYGILSGLHNSINTF